MTGRSKRRKASGFEFHKFLKGLKMNARMVEVALQAWDAVGHLPVCTREVYDATEVLVDKVKSALRSIEGVHAVTWDHGSMGSIYFECYHDTDDHSVSVKFRVSNHKAGRRGNELAGGIVVGMGNEEIQKQLDRVAPAIAEELSVFA